MLDVNRIVTKLRMLDDAALQQYAQMHREDPYTLALAVEESNFRKQLRAAGAAAPMGAPPPSVADQEIAGMTPPEDMGLPQIPMQSEPIMAAGGGLLAFAQGGDMPARLPGTLPPARAEVFDIPEAVDQAMTQIRARPKTPEIIEIERQRAQMREDALRRQEEAEKARQAAMPQGSAGAGLEAALRREETREPSERDDNYRMALLEAGLAMMASTSPHALVGIGEGAQKGVAAYRRGKAELQAAEKARRDVMSRIEEARRAEARGDAEAAYRNRLKADELILKFDEAAITALMQSQGLTRQEAIEQVKMQADALRAQKEIESRERIAGQQIAAAREGRQAADKDANFRVRRDYLTSLQARLKDINKYFDPGILHLTPEIAREREKLTPERNQIREEIKRLNESLRKDLGLPEVPKPPEPSPPPPGSRRPLRAFEN